MKTSMPRVLMLLVTLQLTATPFLACAQHESTPQVREIAALRVDLQGLAERCRHLTGAVETLSRVNTEISTQLEAAHQQIRAMADRTERAEARIADLERVLAEEAEGRRVGDEKTIQVVSEEIAKLLNQSRAQDPPPRPEDASAGVRTYTVARGDTLMAIADAYGVSLAALRGENGLSGDLIREGQSLKIPPPVQRPEKLVNEQPNR